MDPETAWCWYQVMAVGQILFAVGLVVGYPLWLIYRQWRRGRQS